MLWEVDIYDPERELKEIDAILNSKGVPVNFKVQTAGPTRFVPIKAEIPMGNTASGSLGVIFDIFFSKSLGFDIGIKRAVSKKEKLDQKKALIDREVQMQQKAAAILTGPVTFVTWAYSDVYEFVSGDVTYFYQIQVRAKGTSLSEFLDDNLRNDYYEWLGLESVAMQVKRAAEKLHEEKIFHCDLHNKNIFIAVNAQNRDFTLGIIDFDLAYVGDPKQMVSEDDKVIYSSLFGRSVATMKEKLEARFGEGVADCVAKMNCPVRKIDNLWIKMLIIEMEELDEKDGFVQNQLKAHDANSQT